METYQPQYYFSFIRILMLNKQTDQCQLVEKVSDAREKGEAVIVFITN